MLDEDWLPCKRHAPALGGYEGQMAEAEQSSGHLTLPNAMLTAIAAWI